MTEVVADVAAAAAAAAPVAAVSAVTAAVVVLVAHLTDVPVIKHTTIFKRTTVTTALICPVTHYNMDSKKVKGIQTFAFFKSLPTNVDRSKMLKNTSWKVSFYFLTHLEEKRIIGQV